MQVVDPSEYIVRTTGSDHKYSEYSGVPRSTQSGVMTTGTVLGVVQYCLYVLCNKNSGYSGVLGGVQEATHSTSLKLPVLQAQCSVVYSARADEARPALVSRRKNNWSTCPLTYCPETSHHFCQLSNNKLPEQVER
jgi:hypothetical protein